MTLSLFPIGDHNNNNNNNNNNKQLFCVFEGVAQSGAHLDWWMEHLLLCSQNILFVLAVALRSCVFVFILFLFI